MEYIMEINTDGFVVLHTEDFNEILLSDSTEIDNMIANRKAKMSNKNGNIILKIFE